MKTIGTARVEDPNAVNVFVADTPKKGRGVFASRKFKKDDLIERAAVIVIPRKDWEIMEETVLSNYVFDWGENDEDAAMALGSVSLYNHSYTPNAELQELLDENSIEVTALRDIEPGEEVFVNYNGVPDDLEELWFDVIDDTERNPA